MQIGLLVAAHQDTLAEFSPVAVAEGGFSSLYITCNESNWPQLQYELARTVEKSHDAGLEVHVIPCGFGGFLRVHPDDESPMLDAHPEFRQIDNRGRRLMSACPNHSGFLELFTDAMREIAAAMQPDGFLWFQPSFEATETGWACRCSVCQDMYLSRYDAPMPLAFDSKVADFRQRSVVMFLLAGASAIKAELPHATCTVAPTPSMSRQVVRTGNENWDRLLECSGVDGIAFIADWKELGVDVISVFDKPARGALRKARQHGKQCQVWINDAPSDRDEVRQAFRIAKSLGIGRLVVCDHASIKQPEIQTVRRRFLAFLHPPAKRLLVRVPVY